MSKHKEQITPSSVQAEKAILGAILLDNSLFLAPLEPDDFFLESHKLIYLHITQMIGRGEPVDLVTLAEDMRAGKDLDRLGETPVAYLASLSEDTIRYAPAVKDWARIVKAKALQRRLIAACTAAVNKAYDGESGFEIIAALKTHIEEIEADARRGLS